MVDGNEWTRTGHNLVLDMDETGNRKRHPWFLLASEWYDDHCLYSDGDRTIYAEQFVEQGRSDVDGIFPNTNDRTTVARLRSTQLEEQNKTGPFLLHFNPDLRFEITRFGQPPDQQERTDPRYLDGTYLPVIMELYWNPQTKEEVCYNEDKLVYFRYNRLTGDYHYDDPAATDNYIERLPRPISMPSATGNMSQHFSHAKRRRDRDASSRPGIGWWRRYLRARSSSDYLIYLDCDSLLIALRLNSSSSFAWPELTASSSPLHDLLIVGVRVPYHT